MENNRKGNGIFLGIVSVATLIVAIIGATFAYFSATTNSDENAVDLTAYEFNLGMSVTPIYPSGATKLIPLNPVATVEGATGTNTTNLLYALNAAENPCIDDNELQVCALYKIEITNQGTNPITLNGKIITTSNNPGRGGEGFSHLTYQSVTSASGTPETSHDLTLLDKGDSKGNGITAVGTVTLATEVGSLTDTTNTGKVDIDSIYVSGATVDNEGNVTEQGKGEAYLLIYLNDTTNDEDPENNDQSEEMGASFTGQLVFESGDDAGSTLTGTFKVSGNEAVTP